MLTEIPEVKYIRDLLLFVSCMLALAVFSLAAVVDVGKMIKC